MRTDAGKYRFPGAIYRHPSQGKGSYSGATNDAELVSNVWLSIKPRASGEVNAMEQLESIDRYELRTPWFPAEIDATMWVESNGREYAIDGVTNVDEMNMEYLITATARARNVTGT